MSDSIFLTRGGIISGLTDYGKTLNDIVIPDEIDGYAIEYISASVFADCVNLTSVAIPDSVIRISSEAFYGCTNLTTVYVTDPNNLSEAVSSYDWSETGSSGITFAKYVAPVDMLIKNTTLINLADKIRVLSGTEETLTPAEMASTVNTFCNDIDTELSTQDDLIAQIATALEGKSIPSGGSGGSNVIIGEITKPTTSISITIPELIGKDNVALMYMDDCNCPDSAMADSGITSAVIHGESLYYVVHYGGGLTMYSNDENIIYNKTTGDISLDFSYNEVFMAGRYMYVAW